MPRYYFDRYEDGQLSKDGEGVDMSGTASAEIEATRAAFDVAKEGFCQGIRSVKIAVRDEDRHILSLEIRARLERGD